MTFANRTVLKLRQNIYVYGRESPVLSISKEY